MPLSEKTIEKLRNNPHYKPSPGQLPPKDEKEEEVRTFGVPPAMHTVIPKHPTDPITIINRKKKKKIDK